MAVETFDAKFKIELKIIPLEHDLFATADFQSRLTAAAIIVGADADLAELLRKGQFELNSEFNEIVAKIYLLTIAHEINRTTGAVISIYFSEAWQGSIGVSAWVKATLNTGAAVVTIVGGLIGGAANLPQAVTNTEIFYHQIEKAVAAATKALDRTLETETTTKTEGDINLDGP